MDKDMQDDAEIHEHDEHEEHEEHDALSMTKQEILSAKCEHDVPAHQCDECRYEIGVVKIGDALLKDKRSPSRGLVATEKVAKRKMSSITDVMGEISLNENTTTHVSPSISGIVQSVNVDLGAQVKKGDVLFKIDSIEFGKALTEYAKQKSLVLLSGKNLKREQDLYKRKISSERELIETQMAFEKHQTNMKAVKHKLHVLGLNEKEIAAMAHGDLNKKSTLLPVHSPIDGTVIKKHAVTGELIEPGGDVILVASLRTVWVWTDIYENDLALLLARKAKREKLPVEVSVKAFSDRTFSGYIDYIGATMDEGTRTVKVRAIIDNSAHLLRPGMFCKVKIAIGAEKEVLAIPEISLLSDEGVNFVFTHLKDDLYVRRPVTKGGSANGFVEILRGLEVGETIVTEGSFLLKSDVLREKMGAGCAD
jgi:cobalt-zinc-cadmium efflux system membrane fusion protein